MFGGEGGAGGGGMAAMKWRCFLCMGPVALP